MDSEHTFHWREADDWGDMVTVHDVEPFSQLVGALGSHEQAAAYVELGPRASDWLMNANHRSYERAILLNARYPIREG